MGKTRRNDAGDPGTAQQIFDSLVRGGKPGRASSARDLVLDSGLLQEDIDGHRL